MTKPGFFATSVVVAASATALTVASTTAQISIQMDDSKREGENSSSPTQSKEKFAPRFDGLRFIETLVTAHR